MPRWFFCSGCIGFVVFQFCLQTYFVTILDSHIDRIVVEDPRNISARIQSIQTALLTRGINETGSEESINHDVNRKTALLDDSDHEDSAWIDTIQMGKFVGFGSINLVTHVLENGVDQGNLLKITGDHPNERARNENMLDYSDADLEAHRILEPHISTIPRILKFQRRVANPFRSGRMTFHSSMREHDKKWLLKCDYISLILIEQARPDTAIVNDDECVDVPPERSPCFWKKLFETVQRTHDLGIMNRDLSEKNILISGGEIVLFDWNLSKRYYDGQKNDAINNRVWNVRLFHEKAENMYWIPPENKVKENDNLFQNVHGYDVWCIGALIRSMLECGRGGGPEGEMEYMLLKDLYKSMMVENPAERPTLRQLLTHHNYFTRKDEDDRKAESSCKLSW